jgi:hypothetical protein
MKNGQSSEKEKEPQITYQLPFIDTPATHEEIFEVHKDDPLFLRPADIERLYCIPASTIYDWVHQQPETHFPAIKFYTKEDSKRGMVFIPKRLFDQWLVDHSNLMKNK